MGLIENLLKAKQRLEEMNNEALQERVYYANPSEVNFILANPNHKKSQFLIKFYLYNRCSLVMVSTPIGASAGPMYKIKTDNRGLHKLELFIETENK